MKPFIFRARHYMDITALIKDLLTVDSKPLTIKGAALTVGDRLLGTVIALKKEGSVLMDFGRFRAVSEVRFPVQVGEKLPLTVVRTTGQLELQLDQRTSARHNAPTVSGPAVPGGGAPGTLAPGTVVSDKTSPDASIMDARNALPGESAAKGKGLPNRVFQEFISDSAKINLADATLPSGQKMPQSVGRALELLVRHLTPLSMEEPIDHISDRIRTVVDKGGVFFEKKLETAVSQERPEPTSDADGPTAVRPSIQSVLREDLKPRLLLLRNFFVDNPEIKKSHGETTVRKLLSHVERLLVDHEQQHERIAGKRDSAESFMMTAHSIPIKSEKEEGVKLNIFYPRKQKGEVGKNPQISILLEMDHLGAVRSDLVLIGRDLNIRFFVTSEKTRQAMAGGLIGIKQALAPVFDHVGVQIQVSEEKIEQLQSEHAQPPGGKLVDLRA